MTTLQQRFAFRFEFLVRQLVVHLGYDLLDNEFWSSAGPGLRPDVLAKGPREQMLHAEIKWTHRPDVRLKQLRDWSAVAARYRRDGEQALLVASGVVEPVRREWAENEFDIQIWDRTSILEKSNGSALHEEFEELFAEASSLSAIAAEVPLGPTVPKEGGDAVQDDAPMQPRGDQLIARLATVDHGAGHAGEYELVCEEIVDYLFGGALLDGRRHPRLDDGLSILDIVYRVKSQNQFWSALARDFRARVIVFECKNYEGPVGPMQVFTTERYMSTVALRSVCFVLSRTAAHPHAIVAAQGAMRETGKLIIFLHDEDLTTMLRLRDTQVAEDPESWVDNDPTEILDQKIYEFLATMPR
ncbi:hypothetical protein AMC87_CH02879 [Rhizobium phaseoli]|uniref:hypothetical protein n=1 Tax=Rhizobium phaseoli TaxID=396 RepID=UPI0007E92EF6|nr:hypothetical protein [Rhizobium phaseoli]ANL47545.1 hypothetical protein AMC87_CH02879 [Rhizobium phaseoli]